MEHSIRLNLGAGDRHWPGWVNVDCIGDQDLISDVTKLDLIALWNAGYRHDDLIGRALFGMAEPHTMQHKWCYSKAEIGALFAEAGFQNVQFEEPFFHLPQRDLRIVGSKSKE